jgi:hypothetical protein
MTYPITVDGFEDRDFDEYNRDLDGDNGKFVDVDGGVALEYTVDGGTSNVPYVSLSGLNQYPTAGDVMTLRLTAKTLNGTVTLQYARQNTSWTGDRYELRIDFYNGEVYHYEWEEDADGGGSSGSGTSIGYFSPQEETTYVADVRWYPDNTADITFSDTDGNTLAQGRADEISYDYSSGGIGWEFEGEYETDGYFTTRVHDLSITGDATVVEATASKATTDVSPTGSAHAASTSSDNTVTVTADPTVAGGGNLATTPSLALTVEGNTASGDTTATARGPNATIVTTPGEVQGYADAPMIDATPVQTLTASSATFTGLSLTFRARRSDTLGTLRALQQRTGSHEHIETADGGFTTDPRHTTPVTYTPPASQRDVRDAGEYVVNSYTERVVDDQGDVYEITLDLQALTPRQGTVALDESRASGEWAFDLADATIATHRVEYDVTGEGKDGVDTYTLTCNLTAAQTRALERTATHQYGVSERSTPDGPTETVDTTADKTNSLNVVPPSEAQVARGHYVLTDWRTRRINDDFYEAELTIAPVTDPFATAETVTATFTPTTGGGG